MTQLALADGAFDLELTRAMSGPLYPGRQTLSEFFKEWAHNNTPGKKGFQPKASPAPSPKMWEGRVSGPRSALQEEYVREALGKVPTDRLCPNVRVEFKTGLTTRFGKEPVFGLTNGPDLIQLNPKYVRVGALAYEGRYTRETIIRDVIHESGHAVMGHAGWGQGRNPPVSMARMRRAGDSSDARILGTYARRNPDEGWADLFAERILNPGRRLSAENEALFRELGI